MGCCIWYSEEGSGRAAAPPRPLLIPNVTAYPSTASVPITVLLYDCALLRDFNVAIKGLTKELKTARGHMMPPPQHVYNGLVRPAHRADEFTLALGRHRDNGT